MTLFISQYRNNYNQKPAFITAFLVALDFAISVDLFQYILSGFYFYPIKKNYLETMI